MPLWIVDLDSIGEFYIEARTAQAAVASVRRDLAEQLHIEARRADGFRDYEYRLTTNPAERRRLLAGWSRVWSKATDRDLERNRRALENVIRSQEERQEWVERAVAKLPPLGPQARAQIAEIFSAAHARRLSEIQTRARAER